MRIEITNAIQEPPGGWCSPGDGPQCVPIKFGVNICNNQFSDASSNGECSGSTSWPNPGTNEDVKAKLLLPARLTFAGNATCTLDTDGDGVFGDADCPAGSFSVVPSSGSGKHAGKSGL